MDPGTLSGTGVALGSLDDAEGRIVLRESVVDLRARAEGRRHRGRVVGPDRPQVEAVGVDREDATPAADLLRVRHLAREPAGPAGQRAEDDVDQPVRGRAHLRGRGGHDAAKRRLHVGRGREGVGGRARLLRRRLGGGGRQVGLGDELRLRRVRGRRLRVDAQDVLGPFLAPAPEVDRRRVRERAGGRRVLVHHVELATELHVAAHDEVHEAVGRSRGHDGDDAHLRQRRKAGGSVHLDRAEDALVGLVARARGRGRRVAGGAPGRRQQRHERTHGGHGKGSGQRAASRRHSHCARTVHWNPTGSELPRKSGYIGGGAGSSTPLDWMRESVDWTSPSKIGSPLGLAIVKPPTLRSGVTSMRVATCSFLSFVEGNLAADLQVGPEPGDERLPVAVRGARLERVGLGAVRGALLVALGRSHGRRGARVRGRGAGGFDLARVDHRRRSAGAWSSGSAAAVFSALVEGSDDWGCVFAATGCLRCHFDGSFVGFFEPSLSTGVIATAMGCALSFEMSACTSFGDGSEKTATNTSCASSAVAQAMVTSCASKLRRAPTLTASAPPDRRAG